MNLKQNILLSLAILVLGALLLIIIFDDHGVADLHLLKIEKARIFKKNERLVRENISLYRTIGRLKNDLAFIENVARQEMGMIGKDEVIFKLKKQGLKK
jgi:cell division protein FtsB